MSDNPYAPPATAVAETWIGDRSGNEFFVSGIRKLVLLNIATLGLYEIFWFYMHWARYRRHGRPDIWPAARAVFSLFFVHQLAREIDGRLRREGTRHVWSPGSVATIYVVVSVVSYLCSLVPAGVSNFVDVLPLLLLGVTTWCMIRMQIAANLACGQPNAESNRHFTWANWLWALVGTGLWLLVLASFLLPDS